jgi:putative transposase
VPWPLANWSNLSDGASIGKPALENMRNHLFKEA